MQPKQAPVNLNLLSIRQPVTAIVSILHRITGLILFLSLPVLLYFIDLLTANESTAQQAMALYSASLSLRIVFLLVSVSAFHHVLAGVRYLLLDIDIGVTRSSARAMCWAIVVLDIIALPVIGWSML